MAIKLDDNPNNDAQVGGNVVTNVGNPAVAKPVVASVPAAPVVSMVPQNNAPVAPVVTATAPSAAYPASGPQSPSAAPVSVGLVDPNGTGKVGGQHINVEQPKTVVSTPPVVEKEQPQPPKPVLGDPPQVKAPDNKPTQPIVEKDNPSNTPANIPVVNDTGKSTGEYVKKDPDNQPKPTTETTNPPPEEPKVPGGGGDDSSTSKIPEKPVIPVSPPPKEPEPPKSQIKFADAIARGATSIQQSVPTSIDGRKMEVGDTDFGVSVNAMAGNDKIGFASGIVAGGSVAKKVGENTTVYGHAQIGAVKHGDEKGVLGGVGVGVKRDLNEKASIGADLAAFATNASQTIKKGDDTITSIKQEVRASVSADYKVTENFTAGANVGVARQKFDNGDTKNTLVGGVNGVYNNGNLNITGGVNGSRYGVGTHIGAVHHTQISHRQIEDLNVPVRQALMQKVSNQQFTGEFRSHFEFNQHDLQKRPQWNEMLDIFGSTKLDNGKSPLKEAVDNNLPFVITAATDQYGTEEKDLKSGFKGNNKLSQDRAEAARAFITEKLEANPEKYGLTGSEVQKLKGLITINPISESQAMSQDHLNALANKEAAEKGITFKNQKERDIYIQKHISVDDRYVSFKIDTQGRNDVMLANPSTVAEVQQRASATGVKINTGEINTREIQIGEEVKQQHIAKFETTKHGKITKVMDAQGNEITDEPTRQALIQQRQMQQANPNNFDADALQKAINANNAIEAQKAAPTQPTLEHNSQTMRPM